jgi:hypothetical protein
MSGVVVDAKAEREDVPGAADEGFVIPITVTAADHDGAGGVVVELTYPPGTSTVSGAGVEISVRGDQMLIEEIRRDRPPVTL